MKRLSAFIALITMTALSACTGFKSHTEVQALNKTEAVGSAFTRQLTAEYRQLAVTEQDEMMDYPDAIHFARKGLASASGKVIMPEPVDDWNLSPRHIGELNQNRARLIDAFDRGAREIAPEQSAIAQARFDCWIERQEENWTSRDDIGCRSAYLDAISKLESMLPDPEPAPAPATPAMPPVTSTATPEPSEPMTAENAVYLVFFDFDKAAIGPGGDNVLDSVAREIERRNLEAVEIVGHTDTSGPESYNDKLSMRRANAVRDALSGRGVSERLMRVDHKGEDDLLVQTPDNVREPANRRVTISFE